MSQENDRFLKLDRDFRYVFSMIEKDPRVSSLLRFPNLSSTLEALQNQLSRCQKSLDEFLEAKRSKFPRFMFLGDDDLLEIVGQSSKEEVIQNNLKKLFSGIDKVELNYQSQSITAFQSSQGEKVELANNVEYTKPIEDWLCCLETQMRESLRKYLSSCLEEMERNDGDLNPLNYPSQILCLSDSIVFTKKCESAITGATLPPLLVYYKNVLSKYSSINIEYNGNQDEKIDFDVLKSKLKALLLDTTHHISVLKLLIHENVSSVADWHWQKQLRFYSESRNIVVKIGNAVFDYSFEYLGNMEKLVRTTLIDKCFLTLSQGLHLGMGGNPYGPAGTGKTEAVKALGALLGRQVIVFNCDEGIDSISMGRILSGLVQSGAWGCFDEFNRLDEATLSAISMYIQSIQLALKAKKSEVVLTSKKVPLSAHAGIFVTLNPATEGYGGRNRLPDNLKQLFRPVLMSQPDLEDIARIILYCDGYKFADVVGRKLVEILESAEKILSHKKHYDWGLRALKAILDKCGEVIKFSNITKGHDSLEHEYRLVVTALRSSTLSKLTSSDSKRFDSLIRDVFNEIQFHNWGHEKLAAILEETTVELGLQINPTQVRKCIELYEQLKQRMGVALVGPPGSGKSTVLKLLLSALTKMGHLLRRYTFNPKALTREQLLGYVDHETRQWYDGVLTNCALQVYSEPNDVWSILICDGDVDPEWIESLNSVLDDNRLLSLPSGWRIKFGSNVNFVFETGSLNYASPATISRIGIVLLGEQDVHLKDVVENWYPERSDDSYTNICFYIQDFFYKAVDWLMAEGELIIQIPRISAVLTGLSFFKEVKNKAHFAVALLLGLGGVLTPRSKIIFAEKIVEWTNEYFPNLALISKIKYDENRDIIDVHKTGTEQISCNKSDFPLVLTGQILQSLNMLRNWMTFGNERHFLIIGKEGSAKELMLSNIVKEKHSAELVTIYCTRHTTPSCILSKLEQLCILVTNNSGRVFKPKCNHLFIYLKNLHLTKTDQWGTNIVTAFLQQAITHKGLYDKYLEWIGLENITFVGSLTAGSTITPRLLSVIVLGSINESEEDDLNLIYLQYVTSIFKRLNVCDRLPKGYISRLVTTMTTIYGEVLRSVDGNKYKHYGFNPNILKKWCSALSRYKSYLLSSQDAANCILEIFVYESLRLFQDRMMTLEDKEKYEILLRDVLRKHWNKDFELVEFRSMYFVPLQSNDFMKLKTFEWLEVFQRGAILYGRDGQTLNALNIPEQLCMTASLLRVLSTSPGSAILIGRSGTGRSLAARIVSALQSYTFVKISSTKQPNLKNDLKSITYQAGIDGKEMVLYIENNLMPNYELLDFMNCVTSAGDVSSIYTVDEVESILVNLKDEALSQNFDGDLRRFFQKRVQEKLHFVLALDYHNGKLSEIMENCPDLRKYSEVICLSEWSRASLLKIPTLLSQTIKFEESILNSFLKIYETIGNDLKSPTNYVSFIELYLKIYTEKMSVTRDREEKLRSGIHKLNEAYNVVTKLKADAKVQEQLLAEKQNKANAALNMISSTMQNANSQKQEMVKLKKQTEIENENLIKRKEAIEMELSEVEPLVKEACAAINNIRPESLSEIRSLRAPPDIIRDILEGVLRLMGIQDTSWNSMKLFLSKRGVKEDIRSFDVRKISTENRRKVEQLVISKKDSFDPKMAKRASVAAAPLAAWVTSNVRYSYVLEKIIPLEKEQARLQHNLRGAEAELESLSTSLLDVDAAVAELKKQLANYTKEAAEIELHLNRAKETLHAAETLVMRLDDEYHRWKKQLGEISNELQTLPKKCLLAAAFISYLPCESIDNRNALLYKWCDIIHFDSNEFSLEAFMSSERESLSWQVEGLPSDILTMQNAIAILKSSVCPLLLDPSNISLNWLKVHYKERNPEIVTEESPNFLSAVELAIRFGKVLIITEVERINPILLPILRKEFHLQGERRLVLFCGKLIDYHQSFSLVFASRNAHLKVPSDIIALVTVVNFTITEAGLTEQILNALVQQENPELSERKNYVLRQKEQLEEKQFNLQYKLLNELVSSDGDILQNKKLLSSLEEIKASTDSIFSALKESVELQNHLRSEYEIFRPISQFSSTLYFACKKMSNRHHMYRLSVPSYLKLVLKSIPTVKAISENEVEIHKILTQAVFRYFGRGMLKSDHILFALHLAHEMFPEHFPDQEWDLLLNQASLKVDTVKSDESLPKWLPIYAGNTIAYIQRQLPRLYNLLQLNNEFIWKDFLVQKDCENKFPSGVKLSKFEEVLVVQALRPDRLYTCIIKCVCWITGLKNICPEVLQLTQLIKETNSSESIMLISGHGADPSLELRRTANLYLGEQNYVEIAMGEGQESIALQALQECSKTGKWLYLKNLHLVTGWLPVLCQRLQMLIPHNDFRLWLGTEPNEVLSSVLIENSLKLAYEPPQGVKNNVLHTYGMWTKKYFDEKDVVETRILFSLACIHALLQERRTYIPQGWSKWYEFSEVDLFTAAQLTKETLSTTVRSIKWEHLRGLYYNAAYGGHIDDLYDSRILDSYLLEYFNDNILSHKWRPLQLGVSLPSNANYQNYVEAIHELSDIDIPEYFGLPANINRAWQKSVSLKLVEKISALNLPVALIEQNPEQWHSLTSPILNFWKKLNQGQDWIRTTIPDSLTDGSPIKVFLNEETRSSLFLIKEIHMSLIHINKIIRGLADPSKKDESFIRCLITRQTPLSWRRLWLGPVDLLMYLKGVIMRAEFTQQWNAVGGLEKLLSSPINISNFLNPDRFLVALKQHTARSSGRTLDELALTNSWDKSFKATPSVTLTGIRIEGARFISGHLEQCTENSENFQDVADCHIGWVPKISKQHEGEVLNVPLYLSESRSQRLMDLRVPCRKEEQSTWLQAGTSFFLV